VLFGVMIFFGGYGAYLCGQTSVEIVQAVLRPGNEAAEVGLESESESVAGEAG
jgi:hypothetical protein